jgi:hypothetical protein
VIGFWLIVLLAGAPPPAFAALASAPGTDIKVMATALGAGILLDATVVRALLVPAMVSLFGTYNWWLPAGIARLLRVEPSPLTPDAVLPAGYEAGSQPPAQPNRVRDRFSRLCGGSFCSCAGRAAHRRRQIPPRPGRRRTPPNGRSDHSLNSACPV